MGLIDQKERPSYTDIWNAYHDKVYEFCVVYMKEIGDPEDICQDVFLALHERMRLGPLNELTVEIWLYQKARELMRKGMEQEELRRQWTIPTSMVDAEKYTYTLEEVERKMDGREFIKVLKANLSPVELRLLQNAYVEGMTGKQLARLLGISENTLNQRKWRLRHKVERHLERFNK